MRDRIASAPRGHDEPVTPIRVGSTTIVPLVQFHYRVDPRRFFPDLDAWPVDPDAWYWRPPYVVDDFLTIDMGGFLVRTPDRTLLVDAGIGNGKSRPNPHHDHREDPWLDLLRRAGSRPEDVDTVVFTHLHVDHVGFATSWDGAAWVPTFPRAEYVVDAAELEFWTGPEAAPELERLGDYLSDSVLPLDQHGVLRTSTGETEVSEDVRLMPAPGHTPGNVCVELRSQGERAVFVGDMVHHAVQLAFPRWSTDYCVDPARATDARTALLASLDADDLLIAAHFPDSAPGRITPWGEGYRFTAAG